MVSNFHINIIDKFFVKLNKDAVKLNQQIKTSDIEMFETNYNVKLSKDLISFFNFFNGFADEEMYEMYRLWSLQEYKKITQYFSAPVLYSQSLKSEGTEEINNISLQKPIVDYNSNWLIPNAEDYFLFGDYNINGSYWAIRLAADENDSSNNSIICINDVSHRLSTYCN